MRNYVLFAVLAMVMTLVGREASAQGKIGYISLQELIPNMPEFKKANNDMAEHQKALQQQGTDYQVELGRKDSAFKADSTKWTPAMRDVKRKELNDLYVKLLNFNQTAQQSLQSKEQELLGPIQQKAISTTQAVAKENGYTYVLNKEGLISFPASDDLLPLVAKKLQITIGPGNAPSPGTGGGAQKPAGNKPTRP